MINTILDIIRLLNDGNIVPMQKDEDTKIDLYNKKVQLFMDASGEESKYYYFSELEIDDENQDNLAAIEDVALNSDALNLLMGNSRPERLPVWQGLESAWFYTTFIRKNPDY